MFIFLNPDPTLLIFSPRAQLVKNRDAHNKIKIPLFHPIFICKKKEVEINTTTSHCLSATAWEFDLEYNKNPLPTWWVRGIVKSFCSFARLDPQLQYAIIQIENGREDK